ncbi:MAG: hypothetical protein KF877_11290, partial [Bacteroidetes bacterium]|nr:hypothetical protein [Bacteroidota bacterium]
MPEFVTVQEHIERRTYIKGKFKGKFIGYLDHQKSDLLHENFYDLEVLSGEIETTKDDAHIRHWQTGESEEFQPIELFLTKLPESLPLEMHYNDGTIKRYQINLNEPKLSNYSLSKQAYEKNKIFGDIEGDISGYIKHYDTQDIKVEVIPEDDGTIIIPPSTKTSKQTGRTELYGNYKRWEYYYSDGSTYWGDWIKQSDDTGFLYGLLQVLFLLVIVIPLFTVGWKHFLPLLIIGGILYLLSIFKPVIVRFWSWLIRLLGFAFLLFFVFGIISLFMNSTHTTVKKKYATNSKDEIQITTQDPITGDSIISNYRIWQDYNNKEYSGNIRVKVSDFRDVASYRNGISVSPQDPNQYNYIVSKIYDFDKTKLSLLYSMFDSLKTKHNLGETEFAEVITSCIQDIPYTLVLDNECNANRYNDKFISEYLGNGGKCEGYIKFGLLAPTEFMGSLIGDCDTRTLLLFTVLNHYNYDVVMLGSELYRHSVIGINLPYNG